MPAASPAGYSGTPLPRKLGIREGSVTALVRAPDDFERTLGRLPAGARLTRSGRGARALTVWFVRSVADLKRSIAGITAAATHGGVWIAWPKQASGIATDVNETAVRELVLRTELVDHKICAIGATWSGLRFARRRGQ